MSRLLWITVAAAAVIVIMVVVVILSSSVVDRFSVMGGVRKAAIEARMKAANSLELTDPDAMIRIPGGEFMMGAVGTDETPTANLDESPPHKVRVAPFLIGKYEVTNLQYKRFVDETGRRPPLRWKEGAVPEGKSFHPVIYVNRRDAEEYARWAGGRLCTEAEWELAAKGFDGREWPWGNTWDDSRVNVYYTVGDTTPVNAYPLGASPFGVLGMADNVWEWVADPYDRYPGNTLPDWYYQRGYYLLRSGSWQSDYLSSRTTTRNPTNPVYRADYFGIRICRDDGKKVQSTETQR